MSAASKSMIVLAWAAVVLAAQAHRPLLVEVGQGGGESEVVAVSPDGSHLRVVAPHTGVDGDPAWLPDGKAFLFVSDRAGSMEVFTADLDRVDIRRLNLPLPSANSIVGKPDVSPNRERLAFHVIDGEQVDIWTALRDGSHPLNLTRGQGKSSRPDWAPDGQSIYFQSDRAGETALYRTNVDGSHAVRLTPGAQPAVSPDGMTLAYTLHGAIWVAESDGLHPRMLIARGDQPCWSPDGTRLAFVVSSGSSAQLYSARADGSDQQLIPLPYDRIAHPAW